MCDSQRTGNAWRITSTAISIATLLSAETTRRALALCYRLFATLLYVCYSSRASLSWWIAHSTQRLRSGRNNKNWKNRLCTEKSNVQYRRMDVQTNSMVENTLISYTRTGNTLKLGSIDHLRIVMKKNLVKSNRIGSHKSKLQHCIKSSLASISFFHLWPGCTLGMKYSPTSVRRRSIS